MATTTTPFVMRLIGAMALDPVTYEEVEADRSATGQAMLVVVLSSVGAGVGAYGLGNGSLGTMETLKLDLIYKVISDKQNEQCCSVIPASSD